MMDMQLVPLFASTLFSLQIDEDTDELKEDKTFTISQKYQDKHGKQPSSERDFRVLQKYPRVNDILLDSWNAIAKDVLFYPQDFIITTSWFTKVLDGDESHAHLHKNSFYSGVYYFDEYTEDSAVIEFYSPTLPFSDYHFEPTQYNVVNSTSWQIKPQKNKLILFPSFVNHKILTNKGGPRRSLAFNIAPIGVYGEGDSLIDTSWLSYKSWLTS